MSGSQPPQGANMPGMDMPNFTGEGVIPASFFDMPLEFGGGGGDGSQYYQPMSGFPMGELPMSQASDFDALQAQIAASVPPMPTAANPGFIPPNNAAMSSSHPLSVVKMETDEPTSAAGSSPMTAGPSTPKRPRPNPKRLLPSPRRSRVRRNPRSPRRKQLPPMAQSHPRGEKHKQRHQRQSSRRSLARRRRPTTRMHPRPPLPRPHPSSPLYLLPKTPNRKAKRRPEERKQAPSRLASKGRPRPGQFRACHRWAEKRNTPGASRTASQRPADAEKQRGRRGSSRGAAWRG